ncbi:hypothetical protein WJX82_009851 [Trebouxia sp. C0006]
MASDRLLILQARLDHARDELEVELQKGEARDKSLVISYEKLISGLEGELKNWTHTADTIVDVPAEREVSVHIEDGTSYTVTLYSGRLDVKALKESMADEGLVLRTLNGVVPAYDANGMSRTVYNADILGKTKAKTGLKYVKAYPSSKGSWWL